MAQRIQNSNNIRLTMAGEQKETEPKKPSKEMSRRGFIINWLATAWAFFAAAAATGGIATGRFFFPNVLTEAPSTFTVGFPDDFAIGTVDVRFKERHRVWIVRNEEGIYAIQAICTHLGCTPNWLEAENKFKCPCHGSGFYMTGINFEGPAPRPLERLGVTLSDDGQVLVDRSRSFKFEAGQWDDPQSFLQLV